MVRLTTTIGILSLLLLLWACSASTDVAGTATQAGNGYISGVVISTAGTPVEGASVWVRSSDFLADSSGDSTELYETTSNADGRFHFDSLPNGEYAVEIRENDSSMAMHRFTITDNNHDAGQIAVEKSGSYFGTLDTSMIPAGTHFFARVYGLNIRAQVNLFGEFYYPALPAGMQILHIVAEDPAIGLITIDTVYIEAGTADTSGTPYTYPESWARDSIIIDGILSSSGSELTVEDVCVKDENGRVVELTFDNCKLKSIPPAIAHLNALEKLIITNNPLFIEIPAGVDKLTALTHLDISDNGIHTVTPSIVALDNLSYFSIDGNALLQGVAPPPPPSVIEWIDTHSNNPDWRDTQTK